MFFSMLTMPKDEVEVLMKIAPGEEDRIDRFLAARYPDTSRTLFQRLINDRRVTVDGHPVSPKHRLQAGQTVSVSWPTEVPVRGFGDLWAVKSPNPLTGTSAGAFPFPIIFEDDSLLVIDKPPGVAVHPSAGHFHGRTVVELAAPRLGDGPWPDESRPGLVHRLDKDTSGLLVLAKTPEAHARLAKQFERRQVKKIYTALVKGRMEASEGILECRLARDPGHRQRFAVSTLGRWARTEFSVKERLGRVATRVELRPLTGRTHQLRVQLAGFHHPVLGDRLYGAADKDFSFIARQMLHAAALRFQHPETQKEVHFEAPLPNDFQQALKVIRSLGPL